jgi:hypothetical protein
MQAVVSKRRCVNDLGTRSNLCLTRKAAIHVGRERRFLDDEQHCESRSS